MKKRICFALVLVAALLLCASALADGPVNPRRKHVEETVRWQNREAGLLLAGVTVSLRCDTMPELGYTGKFTATVGNDDGSDWVFEFGVSDRTRDSGGYVYFGNPTQSRTCEFTPIVAADYRIYVYLYRSWDTSNKAAMAWYDFTVADKPGFMTLEQKAQEIVNNCRGSTPWETALGLHNWLTEHVYYDTDYEYYGADVLFRRKGVCDSYSKAYKLLCDTAGIGCERVVSNSMNHAWNVIKLGGTWYQVDVTWDDPPGAKTAVSGDEHWCYFCLSDDAIYIDHTRFDVSYDPGCPSMAMNYYIVRDKWEPMGIFTEDGDTVSGWFLDEFYSGNLKASFDLDDWHYYWPNGAGGYCFYIREVQYAIYAEGMRRMDWKLSDGGAVDVDFSLSVNKGRLQMKVKGWKIKETGTLKLPSSLKSVGESAFERSPATTVSIPEGCRAIEAGAFRNSGVRRVYVPDSLEEIAPDAFEGCGRIIFFPARRGNEALKEYAQQAGHLVIEP